MERWLVGIGRSVVTLAEAERFVATPASGGIASFAGVVRDHHDGRRVLRVEYEAVEPLARAKLEEIAREVLSRHDVHRVAALHRTGTLEVGEASVVVAASAAHRDAAFRATRALIDRIKEVLPVWKREHFADGSAAWAEGFAIRAHDPAIPPRAIEEPITPSGAETP